ncbi:MAG TPA: hypothetical protein VN408_29280 [Actinoplanes sp.]|nr:hypothetical protein [Actinoplanes sp.]
MSTLPHGSTLPHIDPALAKRWRSAVHAATAEILSPFKEPGTGRNHYRVTVRVSDADPSVPTVLLLNAALSLVAASAPFELQPRFVEVPAPDVFEHHGFTVATLADLNKPLTTDLISTLSPAERKDLTYHQASQTGEALFNWFD